MSVGGVNASTFDGELTDDDVDPMFALVSVMADLSEEFVEWYEQVAEDLETAGGWLTWIGAAADNTDNDDKIEVANNDGLRTDFTDWMDTIGFNYSKYFTSRESSDGRREVTDIRGKFKRSEVLELLALEVESISSDVDQANVLATGVIGNFNNGTQELISLINTLRGAGRGHIRT